MSIEFNDRELFLIVRGLDSIRYEGTQEEVIKLINEVNQIRTKIVNSAKADEPAAEPEPNGHKETVADG